MEQDRHAERNGTMKDRAGADSMEDLFRSVTSSWTAEKSIVAASALIVLGLLILYRIFIRPLLPVQVRCWFCQEINLLPPDNRNRFDCRHCEQYNGFSNEGDYNKDIPAQRDPSINVFSAEARRNGANLTMYHNGLCELCNNRQARKILARNQFVPSNSKNEAEEFELYSRYLDKNFSLCPTCERHVSNRIAYQDAYLDPHVKRWVSSRWHIRIGSFIFSEYMLFLCSFLPVGSFFLSRWFQILPLTTVLILMLAGATKNRLLFLSFVLRATTVLTELSEVFLENQHRNVLNISSVICAFVAAFGALQTIIGKLIWKKKKSSYPFTNLEDLSKVLSPLLSASYMKLKETQDWVQRKAASQLDSGLGALSLGKPSPGSQVSRPSNQLSPSVPKSFVFGKSSHNSSGIIKQSRLNQSFEEFTPPPSQDNSSSDYFISASRWCCSEKSPTVHGNEDINWDARTTATQRTVHTVVHAPGESSQSAIWTVAVLLAALLLKLCWSDLVYVTRAVYVSLSHVVV